MTFEREIRYKVIKLKTGLPVTCVVVEHDWPEYEVVWAMIQARIEGRQNIIAAQAARIAELEAERDWLHHKSECLNMERKSQDRELAALRRKINEAPVVAWLCNGETYQVKQCSIITDEEFPDQVPLISKEDLK